MIKQNNWRYLMLVSCRSIIRRLPLYFLLGYTVFRSMGTAFILAIGLMSLFCLIPVIEKGCRDVTGLRGSKRAPRYDQTPRCGQTPRQARLLRQGVWDCFGVPSICFSDVLAAVRMHRGYRWSVAL